ncbi:PcfJ domain-containing protein [Kaistia sp. MMO-174]|uniref:PcfJ domain-containing protein n=1 Tax=Kaistia sp. MMO-174 TaxID=3081256 RepID=UPI003016BE24
MTESVEQDEFHLEEPWDRDAAWKEVHEIYSATGMRSGMGSLVSVLVRTHRRSIDYLRQAPAAVVYLSWGGVPRRPEERLHLASRFGGMVRRGIKLKAMLDELHAPYPIRRLSGAAVTPANFEIILALRNIPPSVLAQAIPSERRLQLKWLRALRIAHGYIRYTAASSRHPLFCWLVTAISGYVAERGTDPSGYMRDLLRDFFRYRIEHGGFNFNWTLTEAIAAQERWHAELVARRDNARFVLQYGKRFDEEVDYGGMPIEWRNPNKGDKALSFVALRSGEALFLEGRAMHHCVASYSGEVAAGRSRIFSIREGAHRLATLELVQNNSGRYEVAQVAGPGNNKPSARVHAEVTAFLEKINAGAFGS